MSWTLRKALSLLWWTIIPPCRFDGFPAHIYNEIEKGKCMVANPFSLYKISTNQHTLLEESTVGHLDLVRTLLLVMCNMAHIMGSFLNGS